MKKLDVELNGGGHVTEDPLFACDEFGVAEGDEPAKNGSCGVCIRLGWK